MLGGFTYPVVLNEMPSFVERASNLQGSMLLVCCSHFLLPLCPDSLDVSSSSLLLCQLEAAAASDSEKDLSEPSSGLSFSAVFGTSVSSLTFRHDCAVILF